MHFAHLPLKGAFSIQLEKKEDERGFFARVYCHDAFKREGLDPPIAQVNTSFSLKKGTLRGMHYQLLPKAEDKLVRCIGGSLYDVILDLRKGSPTFGKWVGVTLSSKTARQIYIPEGFAHGFCVTSSFAVVVYKCTEYYSPMDERGIRWNDPSLNISWPVQKPILSDKDRAYPTLEKVDATDLPKHKGNG